MSNQSKWLCICIGAGAGKCRHKSKTLVNVVTSRSTYINPFTETKTFLTNTEHNCIEFVIFHFYYSSTLNSLNSYFCTITVNVPCILDVLYAKQFKNVCRSKHLSIFLEVYGQCNQSRRINVWFVISKQGNIIVFGAVDK